MIYTFYSYKGGVGRSMALANLAEWFYLQGLRVIMVDWDLEAPGLEAFFYPDHSEVEKVRSELGLIDMLMAYKRLFPRLGIPSKIGDDTQDQGLNRASVASSLKEHLPPLSDTLHFIHPREGPGKPSLGLLTAGWRAGDRFPIYAQTVQGFDWSDFYASFQGETYFKWMREQLLSEADVVLVDSRTGVTEMGGVSTRQLADVVVCLCVPNQQNLEGVTRMAHSFRREEILKARGRDLQVVVVPSRIDNSEVSLKNAFEKGFRRELDVFTPEILKTINRNFWDLRLPYVGKYAYSENLVIGNPDSEKDLEEAYKELGAHLVMLAPGNSSVRKSFSKELQRVLGKFLPTVSISYSGHEGEWLAADLRKRLESYSIPVWPDFSETISSTSGSAWAKRAGTLDQTKHLIVVLNQEVSQSETVLRELRYARQEGICVNFVYSSAVALPSDRDSLPWWAQNIPKLDIDKDWESIVQLLNAPCQATRVPFMALAPGEKFVATPSVMSELKAALMAANGNVGLCGPPGSGKTSLAAAVCSDESVNRFFEDGILWLSLGAKPDIPAQFMKLYAALTGETVSFVDVEDAVIRFAGKLESKKCLLVLDDVWDKSHVQPFLQGGSGCVRLITTRNSDLLLDVEAHVIAVAEMRAQEAVSVLTAGINLGPEERKKAEDLSRQLGYWPPTISVANATLLRQVARGSTVAQALGDLAQLLERSGIAAFDDSDHSLANAIAGCLDALTPEQRKRYAELSFFPDSIEIPLTEVSARWSLDEFEAERLVQKFGAMSLLEWKLPGKTVRLHAILRAYMIGQGGVEIDPDSRCEKVFAAFTKQEQEDVRRIVLRLISVGDQRGQLTPRAANAGQMNEFPASVLERMEKGGLINFSRPNEGLTNVVTLANGVVEHWKRLQDWAAAEHEFLSWRQRLDGIFSEWENTGRDNSGLLGGRSLVEAERQANTHASEISQAERLFIQLSHERERRRSLWRRTVTPVAVLLILAFATSLAYWGLTLTNTYQLRSIQKSSTLDEVLRPENSSLPAPKYDPAQQDSPVENWVVALIGDGKAGDAKVAIEKVADPTLRSHLLVKAMKTFEKVGTRSDADAMRQEALALANQLLAASSPGSPSGTLITPIYILANLGQIEKAKELAGRIPGPDKKDAKFTDADFVNTQFRAAAFAAIVRALVEAGTVDDAVTIAKSEHAQHPEKPSLYYVLFAPPDTLVELIDALVTTGTLENFRKAEDMVQELKHQPSDYSRAYYALATHDARNGNINTAKDRVAQISDPDRKSQAIVEICIAYAKTSQFEAAENLADQLPLVDSSTVYSGFDGSVSGQSSTAGPAGYQGLAVNNRSRALAGIATALASAGQRDGALKLLGKVTQDDANRSAVLAGIAIGLAKAGQFEGAQNEADAIANDNARSQARAEIAKEFAKAGKFRSARMTAVQCLPTDRLDAYAAILTAYSQKK